MGIYEFVSDVMERFSDEVSEVSLENSWAWLIVKVNKFIIIFGAVLGLLLWLIGFRWGILIGPYALALANSVLLVCCGISYTPKKARECFYFLLYALSTIELLLLVDGGRLSWGTGMAAVLPLIWAFNCVYRFLVDSGLIVQMKEVTLLVRKEGVRGALAESLARGMIICV